MSIDHLPMIAAIIAAHPEGRAVFAKALEASQEIAELVRGEDARTAELALAISLGLAIAFGRTTDRDRRAAAKQAAQVIREVSRSAATERGTPQ